MNDRIGAYLLSLPERVLRSASAVGGGLAREIGEIALPAAFRRTRLYRSLVEDTLRFLIEKVGEVEGAFPSGELAENFAVRRAAGNGIEVLGILAFRASPVWVLAALADLSGAGRQLVREIGDTLNGRGLLEGAGNYETVDQLLDGLEKTAGHLAETVNTPPLDVAGLRREWSELRRYARGISVPSTDLVWRQWNDLKQAAAAQNRSVFEVSSLVALSALRNLPENARWLSRCAPVAARRTGELFGQALLDHYRATLDEIRATGYLKYWVREFRPYLRAAAGQFLPGRPTWTGRLLNRRRG